MTYKIIDISDYEIDINEPLGTKSKFWVYGPKNKSILFKSIKTQDKQGKEIFREGEDWAEKIACELSKKLGIPCAHYDLAIHKGINGVITPNFIENNNETENPIGNESLITGNELINQAKSLENTLEEALIREEIISNITSSSTIQNEKQEIENIYSICEKIIKNKPKNCNSFNGVKTAVDFMIGYLMLDALISNQDRHSQNWGMIQATRAGKNSQYLAPTFDHAASLGRNESDEKRGLKLQSKDVGQQVCSYAARSKSHFYLNNTRLKTMEALFFFTDKQKDAAQAWGERLSSITDAAIWGMIDDVPEERMSKIAKEFSFAIIKCNRDKILNHFKNYPPLSSQGI